MKTKSTCSSCQSPLPADAPGGHCPACLLSLGMAVGETGIRANAPLLRAGDRVGRYLLLEEIGEGGCGIVFLAEQAEPVRRRVALKVIKPGMDTRQVIARFEAERQALALLDHPNIARVFDAGATESGRPFFVMELVRGLRINEYCDQQKLSLIQRLELFIQVCQAVQHAHQKGIIHRDLKPSNILVTAEGLPKIIDFGIAKSTAQTLTDKTLFTAFTQFLGTPAYTSPEQAGPGADIDTRSDVYSLGALLYELLTGRTPFSAEDFQSRAPDEMLRLIREHEPLRPSLCAANLDAAELNRVAQDRRVEPNRLPCLLGGDLDWIVMKCLEKDRARRYESASALAADLQRHLSHDPVHARPPGNLYRLGKTVRRNQVAFGAAAALTVTLVFGIGASSYQAARAKTETGRSEQVSGFLTDIFQNAQPSIALGRDTTMLRDILDRAVARASHDLANQPEAHALVLNTLADTYRDLGRYTEMEALARESLRLSRAQSDGESLTTAKALDQLSEALARLGRIREAESASREALALRKKLSGAEDTDVSLSLVNLAIALRAEGRFRDAEALFRDALARNQKLLGVESPEVATDWNNLGAVLWSEARYAEAESAFRQSLGLLRKTAFSENPRIASTLNNLSATLAAEGRLAEAETLEREALALDRKFLAADHPQLLTAMDNLSEILSAQGQTIEAEALKSEARAVTSER